VLNREFGNQKKNEERAAEPLAGGIVQRGHQCGLLWGASLAVGAESFRRCSDRGQAIALAVTTTQSVIESFSERARGVNCRDVTGCNLRSAFGLAKFFFTGRFLACSTLAGKWIPEAIRSVTEGLAIEQVGFSLAPVSCASRVAERMGANDEEMATVAGLAGGMGLSGNGCGALAAAIWMHTLARCRRGIEASTFPDPKAVSTLRVLHGETGSKTTCREITGRRFQSIDEHTEFVIDGGCDRLIDVLARS
jgi:hypothetical protein